MIAIIAEIAMIAILATIAISAITLQTTYHLITPSFLPTLMKAAIALSSCSRV